MTQFFAPSAYEGGADGGDSFTFNAAANQQIEQAPNGTTVRTWDYENQQTGILKPNGSRVTMAYSADFRRVSKES